MGTAPPDDPSGRANSQAPRPNAPVGAAALGKRTLLGLPKAGEPGSPSPDPHAPAFNPKRTLIGGMAPVPAGADKHGALRSTRPGGTFAADGPKAGQEDSSDPLASRLHPGADPSQLGRTLLGMPAAQHEGGPDEPSGRGQPHTQPSPTFERRHASAEGHIPLPRGVAPQLKTGPGATILGVAVPGIAPLNPGVPKPETYQRTSAPPVESASLSVADPPSPPDGGDAVWPQDKRHKKGAMVLFGVASALLLGIALFVMLWDPAPPLQARVDVAADGTELLEIRCANCPQGSEVRLGDIRASFEAGRALIPLVHPLPVGSNALTVSLTRPGLGRDESIPLTVPVHHRVQTELSGLRDVAPTIGAAIEALPGSVVELSGRAIPLTDGRALVPVDISDALHGQASEVSHLERELSYRITPPAGPPREGALNVTVPIVPLMIDTPRGRLITDAERFMLSGRTDRHARVTVTGKPIAVDPEGRFAQLMSIDSVGETTILVRADAEGQAPRLVRLHIERVADLKTAAGEFRRGAITGYTEALSAAATPGEARVALQGRVEEARVSGHAAVVLLGVEDDCPASPCLARILLPRRVELDKGDPLAVYGTVTGTVDGPLEGSTVLAVDASFVVD